MLLNRKGDASVLLQANAFECVHCKEEAHDALDHLDLEWYCEEQTTAAAFARFDKQLGLQ